MRGLRYVLATECGTGESCFDRRRLACFATMSTLAEVTRQEEDTILDAQVACQQQQIGADETSARALVVDVRVHDREVAKTPSTTLRNRAQATRPSSANSSRLVQEHTRPC